MSALNPTPNSPVAPPPILLTIAGFDPTSGAGITADLKVFAAHRCYGTAAPTALTVQSTVGVRQVQAVAPGFLAETLSCLADDLPPSGIKIGMLGSAANVQSVCRFLDTLPRGLPIVVDPVLRSSSGRALLTKRGLAALRSELLPRVSCLTPNVDELLLLAAPLVQPALPLVAAQVHALTLQLAAQIPGLAIVSTGGHLSPPDDCVLAPGRAPVWLPGTRIDTPATHGTGCAFSSALLCALVAGLELAEAARSAKAYISAALQAATPIGRGGGSMHHLYAAFPSHQ